MVIFLKIPREIVEKASAGDRDAFGEIYYSCYRDFYNFALFTVGNPEDATDVVADSFVEILRGIGKLRNPEAFSSWAFRILGIRCKKEIREIMRRRGILNFDELGELPSFGSENMAEVLSESASLFAALSALEPEDRMIVVLYVLHGYTHREISEITGRPEGTVKSRLYRAYEKLRKLMKE